MSRGSSRRLMPEPKRVAMSLLLARAGRGLNRGDDVLVTGAAAEIAFERVADLRLRGLGLLGEEIRRRHDHARGTEAAVQPMLIPERLLQRLQSSSVAAETLAGAH